MKLHLGNRFKVAHLVLSCLLFSKEENDFCRLKRLIARENMIAKIHYEAVEKKPGIKVTGFCIIVIILQPR
jgi:hypothetical protein